MPTAEQTIAEITSLAKRIDGVIRNKRFGLRCSALITLLAHYIAFELAQQAQRPAINIIVEELRDKLVLSMAALNQGGTGPGESK